MRDAADEQDWFRLLDRVWRGVPMVYIILDAEVLAYATRDSSSRMTRLLEGLDRLASSTTTVKIVVPVAMVDTIYMRNHWDLISWRRVNVDNNVDLSRTGDGNGNGKRQCALPDLVTRREAQRRLKRRRRSKR